MKKFKTAYQLTTIHEGVYVNDPADRGGETVCGISRRFWPKWAGWELIDVNIKNYPQQEWNDRILKNLGIQGMVFEFYYVEFWLKNNCEAFAQEIANELFDTGVNQGRVMAGTYLQQSLNKLNRNQKDFPDLVTDGQIGQKTRQAYEAYMHTSRFSSRNEDKLIKWLLKWMNYYQLRKYDLITNNDLSQEKFVPGWTERT